ncbi:MAG: histone deacetylase, partial [Ignavibacteriaceae bacterium]|nr:histone deacetylase [Ignavibacteriaceae bacterium]
MSASKTGIVYDPIFLKHTQPGHPENANRLNAIINNLESNNLLPLLEKVPSRIATIEELCYCHSENYIKRVKEVCLEGGGYLDADTYVTEFSFDAATTAVGSLIDLTNKVCSGSSNNGYALVRPPGHHALTGSGMGFCIFGNAAIAVKAALKNFNVENVAIVDIDVHHGNGTEAMVKDDPNILYISTHQFPYYPGTGGKTKVGSDVAAGTVLNIPLEPGIGDEGFQRIYNELIIPKLEEFNPNIIIVSAGYDAHWNDPLANLNLSLTGYSWISKVLVDLSE